MKRSWASSSASTVSSSCRVILLLDLDCFYAQCEVIRLGLDRSIPCALMQWNAALAVNYPAREFGIKRGDSFDMVKEKSSGKCVALHLPVKSYEHFVSHQEIGDQTNETHNITVSHDNQISGDIFELDLKGSSTVDDSHISVEDESTKDDLFFQSETFDGESSLDECYKKEFCLSSETQVVLFEKEKNVMRNPSDGKASLDRYRLASSKIFDVILKSLVAHLGKDNFILERASIDELFIDITKSCYSFDAPAWSFIDDPADSFAQTIIYGDVHYDGKFQDDEVKALERGCEIARGIRSTVFNQLGFTMSAGIASSKTFAKLAATFGKPNGQAVVFPQALTKLINQTPLRKVRNLGGKIGKKVIALLPESEDTLGSITRHLTLDQLSKHLGESVAKMVLDLAHGLDDEPVKSTIGALPKSITSFKSFPATSDLVELEKWLNLLANDIFNRVDLDSKRNHRYPKTCTVHIHSTDDPHWNYGSSVRIPFPSSLSTGSSYSRIEHLKVKVRVLIQSKAKTPINRLGLCATNFEAKAIAGPITAYFGLPSINATTSPTPTDIVQVSVEHVSERNTTMVHKKGHDGAINFQKFPCINQTDQCTTDYDGEYARQLQASFDRENAILTSVERRHGLSNNQAARPSKRPSAAKGRIDCFFSASSLKKP